MVVAVLMAMVQKVLVVMVEVLMAVGQTQVMVQEFNLQTIVILIPLLLQQILVEEVEECLGHNPLEHLMVLVEVEL